MEHEQGEEKRGRKDSQADSVLSMDPHAGLDLRTHKTMTQAKIESEA